MEAGWYWYGYEAFDEREVIDVPFFFRTTSNTYGVSLTSNYDALLFLKFRGEVMDCLEIWEGWIVTFGEFDWVKLLSTGIWVVVRG